MRRDEFQQMYRKRYNPLELAGLLYDEKNKQGEPVQCENCEKLGEDYKLMQQALAKSDAEVKKLKAKLEEKKTAKKPATKKKSTNKTVADK